MRFRWKLMILLVLIALVPIGSMRIFGIRGVQLLGEELVARSREILMAVMQALEDYRDRQKKKEDYIDSFY